MAKKKAFDLAALPPKHLKALKESGILDRIKGGGGAGKFDWSKLVGLIQTLLPLLLSAASGTAPAAAQRQAAAANGLDLSGLTSKKILALIKALIAALESSGVLETVPEA